MAKILLVEDDNNLREIYGARLEAEGYEIVSAGDGEEALAVTIREKPDLIIADIMMPKISGYDMLDIIRATPEIKDVKVIVMTALSQEEDRQRSEQLGAYKHVVKSQATLDDIVAMVREILGPVTPAAAPTNSQPPAATDDDTPVEDTTPPEPSAQDTATLNQEVAQFVANSPLMNGSVPESVSELKPDTNAPKPPTQTT